MQIDIPAPPRPARRLAQRAVVGAVTAALAMSMVACTDAPSTNGQNSTVDTLRFDAPMTPAAKGPVQKVTWNLPYGEPISLDWTKDYNYSENTVLANMCEGLIRQNPDYSLVPGLATSWTNPSPTTWVYKIRQGVKFWNGDTMTAEDVAYSIHRHVDPAVGSYWGLFYANFDSVSVTAPDEVTVKLKQPDYLFNQMLATPAGIVGQKAYIESKGADYGSAASGAMCTGPFKFDSWKSGVDISLKKFDGYWDTALSPKTSQLLFTFVTDAATLTDALLTGDIDGTYELPVAGIAKLRNSDTGKLYLGVNLEADSLLITPRKGPLANKEVRQALSLALPREQIAAVIYQNTAAPLRALYIATPVTKDSPLFTAETGPTSADLAAAKSLVKAAKVTEPVTIAVSAASQLYRQMAEVIQSSAKEIGLKVTLVQMPIDQFNTLYYDADFRSSVDAFLAYSYMDVADPLQWVAVTAPSSPYNYSGFADPVRADLVTKALQASTEEQRNQLLTQIQDNIMENLPQIPVVAPAERLYLNKRLTGVPTSWAYVYYPWAAGLGSSS